MYAKLLRFDVGFGRPRAAEEIAAETEKTMARWPGFASMELLSDYLGGRYTLIAYWRGEREYYDFSHSADARELEETVGALMSGVPYIGFYQVYQPA
jgi:heme-degrading monooxygenase HmoA